MKIAVISDVHGNMEALESVLLDIKNEKANKIFCLGDLALAGPEPSKTVKRIKELFQDDDFSLIQGNTDEMLSEFSQDILDNLKKMNETMSNAYVADCEDLDDSDRAFLNSLDKQKEVEFLGVKILLVHGSPRKNNENIYPDLPLSEVEEMIEDTNAHLVLCGHTHMPCGYQTNTNQTVVNVGSVGRPFSEEPKSCYLLIDIYEDSRFTVYHKFVSYDIESASKKLEDRKFKGAEKLAYMLKKATSRYP